MQIKYDGRLFTWQCEKCQSTGYAVSTPPDTILCPCGDELKPHTVDAGSFLKRFRASQAMTKKEFSEMYAEKLGKAPRTIAGWERRTVPFQSFKLLLAVLK